MGKPVWLLVAHVGDWRWLKDRTDSPWYPTMRLFRQQATGRWDDVLEQVAWELEAMANAGQPPSPAFAVPQTSASCPSCLTLHHGITLLSANRAGKPAINAP